MLCVEGLLQTRDLCQDREPLEHCVNEFSSNRAAPRKVTIGTIAVYGRRRSLRSETHRAGIGTRQAVGDAVGVRVGEAGHEVQRRVSREDILLLLRPHIVKLRQQGDW